MKEKLHIDYKADGDATATHTDAEGNKTTKNSHNLKFTTSAKEALLLSLRLQAGNKSITKGQGKLIQKAIKVLARDVKDMAFTYDEKTGRFNWQLNLQRETEATIKRVKEALENNLYLQYAAAALLGKQEEFITGPTEGVQQLKPLIDEGKHRRSGQYIDLSLKYNKPGTQLNLFEQLTKPTQDKIIATGANIEQINRRGEAINLSKGHYKLIDAITELLYIKSVNTLTQEGADFYSGNAEDMPQKFGGEERPAPQLSVTLYEVAKKFNGDETPSGKTITDVTKLLTQLSDDPNYRPLIRYTRTVETKKNTVRKEYIEEFQPLLRFLTAGYTEYTADHQEELGRDSEVVIILNPIFKDQIDKKWVEYPNHLTRRMIKAAGTKVIPEATYRLRDYLARERSVGRYTSKIGKVKLMHLLCPMYMQQGRRALIEKQITQAIETTKCLGLLTDYSTEPGRGGEDVYLFQVNKKWT